MNAALLVEQVRNKASSLAGSCGNFDLHVYVNWLFWTNQTSCSIKETLKCSVVCKQTCWRPKSLLVSMLLALCRNVSGRALFPEKQLLFGYGGNETGVGWVGGGTLKEMALHCDVQTTGCDMQELNHVHISQLRFHEATVCLFGLSQVQFDNHLSVQPDHFLLLLSKTEEFSELTSNQNETFNFFCLILC